MRSLIICEGVDDLYILGHYLFKTENWKKIEKSDRPEDYILPIDADGRQKFEISKKDNDFLDIWAVGGDTLISEAFDFLYQANKNNLDFPIEQVFVVMDKDDLEIESRLKRIESRARKHNIQIKGLQNNQSNKFTINYGVKTYQLNVVPIIIPFEYNGALETILLKSIAEKSDEDEHVVGLAENHIESFLSGGKQDKYLTKRRLVTKAKLSSAISITHPDRTAVLFRDLLMSHNWEEHDAIKKHFKMLNELL